MPTEIFLSYRASDASEFANRLHSELLRIFDPLGDDPSTVFMDIRRSERELVGPFNRPLEEALSSAEVIIPIIGPTWADDHRLKNPEDWVRKEIEVGLKSAAESDSARKTVLPVLLNGGFLPTPSEMSGWPPDAVRFIEDLRKHHAVLLRSDKDTVRDDIRRLVRRILIALGPSSRAGRMATVVPQRPAQRIILQYDLAGFASALADPAREWKGASPFVSIAAELLMDTRALIAHELDAKGWTPKGRSFHWQPTPAGGVFVLNVEGDQDKSTLANRITTVAAVCLDTQDKFPDVLGRYAISDGRGVNWAVDLRISVAAGDDVRGTSSQFQHNEVEVLLDGAASSFVGPAVSKASTLLEVDVDDHMPFVGRGTVAILPAVPLDDLSHYVEEPIESDVSNRLKSALGDNEPAAIWVGRRRKPILTHIRITDATVKELRRRTLAPPEKINDLPLHQPPRNYPAILEQIKVRIDTDAETKTRPRVCVIVGEPGTGKTLCALRLVAELMLLENLAVQMPPVTRETWKLLPLQFGSDRVLFLDDAFGKLEVSDKAELEQASLALDPSNGFLHQTDEGRPALIITMREQIWKSVAATHEPLARLLSPHVVVFEYDKAAITGMFEGYWGRRADATGEARHDASYKQLKDAVGERLGHPLSISDFADDRGHEAPFEALRHLDEYRRDPLSRYTDEIATSDTGELLFLALIHAFASAFLREDEVARLFAFLCEKCGWETSDPDMLWRHPWKGRKWGTWRPNGHYEFKHPLREEAMRQVFVRSEDKPALDKIFGVLRHSSDVIPGVNFTGIDLAAFAAPRFGHVMHRDSNRHKCLHLAKERSNDRAAQTLARSVGQVLPALARTETPQTGQGAGKGPRRFLWGVGRAVQNELLSTKDALTDVLLTLLKTPDDLAFGAAFTAFCDSYGPETAGMLEGASARALNSLKKAIATVRNDRGGGVDEFSAHRAANRHSIVVEQAAWAIACNFQRLPDAFRRLLVELIEKPPSVWLKLRSIEAIADYIRAIPQGDNYRKRIQDAINASADRATHDLIRRGVAGAIEANFDEFNGARRLINWLTDTRERERFGFIEWVIWACAYHLKDLLKYCMTSSTNADYTIQHLLDGFEKLARHEDARVRMWLAWALSEAEEATREREELLSLLERFAHDRDEVVRDVAVRFLLGNQE